jgi:hypothetical protein
VRDSYICLRKLLFGLRTSNLSLLILIFFEITNELLNVSLMVELSLEDFCVFNNFKFFADLSSIGFSVIEFSNYAFPSI